MIPAAIDTWFAGRRFRSRLEAKWAFCFEELGIDWDYEPIGFNLPSGAYLPDFFIRNPICNLWVEVKGTKATDSANALCKELHDHSGHGVLLVQGGPADSNFSVTLYQADKSISGVGTAAIIGVLRMLLDPTMPAQYDYWRLLRIAHAVQACRFEHGEEGCELPAEGTVVREQIRKMAKTKGVAQKEIVRLAVERYLRENP